MDPLDALRDRLALIADSATAALTAATGGASLCSVSRSGERVPGVKYPEGRWAAATEARRALRDVTDTDAARRVVAGLAADWTADLERRRSAGAEDWVAYRLGGLDALGELTEHLDQSGVAASVPPGIQTPSP